jgi:hypothetical protein
MHFTGKETRALQRLYLVVMGKYSSASRVESLAERRRIGCEVLSSVTSIGFLCQILNKQLSELPL